MEITQQQKDGISILVVEGDLVAIESSLLEEKTLQATESSPQAIIFDLSQLSYIDSVGLGMIVQLNKKLSGMGVRLCFCCLSESVKRLFAVTRLDAVLEIFADVEEAATAISAD
ncbi:MAG: STAS domain-containing protein [Deltaproteobacteria bacterium]|nr:STAS domain-containing protein [Deltaproteobacteria bacterium]